jgi:ABC-2 type transport system ATP-binding protein
MRQRLGLAQALLHSPALLILDEPTNGLDPAGIREIRTYIRKVAHEEGIAVFVSSHMLSEMQMMCDRIGIIQDGHLVSVETVGDFVGDKVNTVIEVEPIEKAREFVEQTFPELNPKINGNELLVSATREKVPALVKALAEHEFSIYKISSGNRTLEEKFLEMTEGR